MIGKELKELMKSNGLRQSDCAERLGVSERSLNRWCSYDLERKDRVLEFALRYIVESPGWKARREEVKKTFESAELVTELRSRARALRADRLSNKYDIDLLDRAADFLEKAE